jgi:hypothetical protein
MLTLICEGGPPTGQKTLRPSGRAFLERVRNALDATGSARSDDLLYGIVYWFTRGYDPAREPDADNMSKKVWDDDGLQGRAYRNDSQVRLRIAGIVDVGQPRDGDTLAAIDVLDLPETPSALLDAVGELIADDAPTPGFTYIEVGRWTPALIGRCLRGAR